VIKVNYDYKIKFGLNQPFDIIYVNDFCTKHPDKKVLVEVQNTKGISSLQLRNLTSNVLIRIAGGYDEKRVSDNISGDLTKAVIYTRNETIKILEKIEIIESGINKNWGELHKLVYIYSKLKSGIMYDPKAEKKSSSEIRSLRGLITEETVCAGYALIFKEMMDRQDIQCEYVSGLTDRSDTIGHAWNIIEIDGKKYPIDLTWDNTKFRSGKFNTYDYLGQDVKAFSKAHYPKKNEKTQNYEQSLTQIDLNLIKQISLEIGIEKEYKTTTYTANRDNGSSFVIVQIGDNTIDNTDYYRYYFAEIANNGKRELPLILYSEVNVIRMIESIKFGKQIPEKYSSTVRNILFSKENIADSVAKNTYYIGKASKNKKGDNLELITSINEITKPEEKNKMFYFPTKTFIRSDGTVLIAQQMLKAPNEIKGEKVMTYHIFEMINQNGKDVLKRNVIFTERNFFKDTRQKMVDDYLSRSRLDRKVKEAGGYIGYYDANGFRTYNPDLVSHFGSSKKSEILTNSNLQQPILTKNHDENKNSSITKLINSLALQSISIDRENTIKSQLDYKYHDEDVENIDRGKSK
jgi:hypothetical protein